MFRFVVARLFHVLKLKLFFLLNNVLAKRVNVNINDLLVVEHSHLLLLASRLILVATCLLGLSQSLELLFLFVKSPPWWPLLSANWMWVKMK